MPYLLGILTLAVFAWWLFQSWEIAAIVLVTSSLFLVPVFLLSSLLRSFAGRKQRKIYRRMKAQFIVDGRTVVNDNRTVIIAGEKPKGGANGTEKFKQIDG